MTIKYPLDREKFIHYFPIQVAMMIMLHDVYKALIEGSEFILTAQDVLDKMDTVPTHLLIAYQGIPGVVRASDCELVYMTPDGE